MAVNTTVEVTLPAMGESVTEGTVLEWHKAEGDRIEVDETLVEISTDKVDAEVPAPSAGTITELLAAEGETVTVGQVIARMRTGAAAAQASPNGKGAAAAVATPAVAPSADGVKTSPVAARMAAAEGVDLK